MSSSPSGGCRATSPAFGASTSRHGPADLSERGKAAATVSVYYLSLQPFWKWGVEEGEISESLMRHMKPPIVPEQPVPVLSDDQLRTLLDGSSSSTHSRRSWRRSTVTPGSVTVTRCSGMPSTRHGSQVAPGIPPRFRCPALPTSLMRG